MDIMMTQARCLGIWWSQKPRGMRSSKHVGRTQLHKPESEGSADASAKRTPGECRAEGGPSVFHNLLVRSRSRA